MDLGINRFTDCIVIRSIIVGSVCLSIVSTKPSVFIFIVEVKKYTLYIILYTQVIVRCPGQGLDLCLTQFCTVMDKEVDCWYTTLF